MLQQRVSPARVILLLSIITSISVALGFILVAGKIGKNNPPVVTNPVTDMRCGQKAKVSDICSAVGFEFDTIGKKCVIVNGAGCIDKLPFGSLEECRNVCEEASAVPAREEVTIISDSIEYNQAETVKVVIKNNSDKILFIDYPDIERFENDHWIRIRGGIAWPGCMALGGMPYLPVDQSGVEYQWDQKEKWCNKDNEPQFQEVGAGKYRIASRIIDRVRSEADDPNNISGLPAKKFIYSREFTVKEKLGGDPRCNEQVEGIGNCDAFREGYDLDSESGMCGGKGVTGCTFKIPFDSIEECRKVCENDSNVAWKKELDFKTIEKRDYSSNMEEKNYAIMERERLSDLWIKMGYTRIAPFIDFNNNMIIAVFQGEKTTGGYSIEINKIIETKNTIEVSVMKTSPGRGCIVTKQITSPYHIVQLPISGKEVKFNMTETVNHCVALGDLNK